MFVQFALYSVTHTSTMAGMGLRDKQMMRRDKPGMGTLHDLADNETFNYP